ncbi:hypothetical protein Bca52824_094155 [Brassica carinata]|uniref:DNA polymerase alpha/delta/epsilon subunit B domain-containing protein n=1 Tax=Brassica carinata TaxID=52824 RepID=A0A8X7TJ84_BRACI|nr:hypothetical protein Bca52824_094155 [Brassica carinata]
MLLSIQCRAVRLTDPLQFQLLVDHITGHVIDDEELGLAAQIVHMVIAGNSVEFPRKFLTRQNMAAQDQSKLYEPINELDIMLNQIAAGVSLDIMPGMNDPANFALPQQDPFLIETCPHVYFVGNQEKYDTRLVKEGQLIRLICIPKFSETGAAVEVNLRNLEYHTRSFSIQLKS